MIIFKFDVLINNSIVAQVHGMRPDGSTNSAENNTPSMSFSRLNSCECNCSLFPHVGDVLFEEEIESVDVAIANGPAAHDTDDRQIDMQSTSSETTEVCYSETFSLKGSTFHLAFQNVLGDCKRAMLNEPGHSIELRFFEEPINVNDENAIVVQAKTGDCFSSIGYVPGRKVNII